MPIHRLQNARKDVVVRIMNRKSTHPRNEEVQSEARYFFTICVLHVETLIICNLREKRVVG